MFINSNKLTSCKNGVTRNVTVRESSIISHNPPDNMPTLQLKTSSCTNIYESFEKKKSKGTCFYNIDFPASLSFSLHTDFLHEMFREVRGVETEGSFRGVSQTKVSRK